MLIKSVDSLRSVSTIVQQKLDSFLIDKRSVSEKIISLINENGALKANVKDLNQLLLDVSGREKKYRQILDSISNAQTKISVPAGNDARIYPIPVVNVATIEVSSYLLSDVTIVIVDSDGKKVFAKKIKMESFKTIEEINLSALKAGPYFAFIQFADGQTRSIKLFKS